MSSKDMARRTLAEFVFAGANITNSIRPYFLSATYTDNEEDETDDLQIKLQDREDIWLTKWLTDIIDVASGQAPVAGAASTYTVVSGDTLWGISKRYLGDGARFMEIFNENSGTLKDPSKLYPGQVLTIPGGTAGGSSGGASSGGFKIQSTFVRQNWNGDGKDVVLDCGEFEVDSVDASGPPNIVTIKATSLPYTAQIRQTKKTKAWEAYTLSGIANEMAAACGMTCMYLSDTDPYYERTEQYKTSDIAFLSTLCHNAGISLKTTNNIIVLFDQATYEAKTHVATIKRGDGTYLKHKLHVGAAESEYSSCRVSYTDPETGKCISAIARVEDYDPKSKSNQRLEVKAKVSTTEEAKALAEKRLRLHNKYEKTATFTMPGNPALMAGVTVVLSGWGAWSGKYIISQAKHTVGSSGYTTQIKLRRVLEGY